MEQFCYFPETQETEVSVLDLIGTLDVEEKAREKDTRARVVEGASSAHMVQKKNFQPNKLKNNKNKTQGKGKFDTKNKPSHSTNFKKNSHKKGKGLCHVCGDPNHQAPKCPNLFEEHEHEKRGKFANVVISDTDMKESGCGILPTILSVFQSPDWLIDIGANIHVCANASMFSSYQVTGTSPVLMGNGSHAIV